MIKKVACGISGGVDSAVAAHLLKKKGKDVLGVFMRNWDKGEEGASCSAEQDEEDATFVCKKLDIPLLKVDFVKEYWNEVFSNFLSGYKDGLTPNPDVLCNKHIKFGHFHQHCRQQLKADVVATGHYANHSYGQFGELQGSNERARLLKSKDASKDQTLFLSQISQQALASSIFPLGGLLKTTVKDIARQIDLDRIADKKESTGICFIGKKNFKEFIAQYQEESRGVFVDLESGHVVGEHKGVHLFTKGQRTLIGGVKEALFVVDRDPDTQIIYVVAGSKHPALFTSSFFTSQAHWICDDPFKQLGHQATLRLQFRFQHTHTPIDCLVTQLDAIDVCEGDGEEGGGSGVDSSPKSPVRLHIQLSKALRAVAPGQYAALYRGDECLGSAVILRPPTARTAIHKAAVNSMRL